MANKAIAADHLRTTFRGRSPHSNTASKVAGASREQALNGAIATTLTHRGLPQGASRFDLLRLFEQVARPGYGLSCTAVALVRQYVLKTLDVDYAAGRICAVWSQACRFAEALGLTSRSINSAERELERAGFIRRTAGINGNRTGDRHDGVIAWAAGINLAPLVERFAELRTQAEALGLAAIATSRCRAEIRQLGKRIRDAGDAEARGRAEEILPGGRTARVRNLTRLVEIRDALVALVSAIESKPCSLDSTDAPEENCAPELQNHQSSRKRTVRPAEAAISPAMAITVATDDYRVLVDGLGGATWYNLVEASWRSCARLRISQRIWGSACRELGRERAALCVLLIDRNAGLPTGDRFRIRWPGRCLAGMIRRAATGEMNLAGLFYACRRVGAVQPQSALPARASWGDPPSRPLAGITAVLMSSFESRVVGGEVADPPE